MTTDGIEKLSDDLRIFERCAEEFAYYLTLDVIYYSLGPLYPQLTTGGTLMRQHRLLLLRDLLDGSEQQRLDQAVAAFQLAITDRIAAFQNKAHREMGARLRQWTEYLRDLRQRAESPRVNYATAVEPRVMLQLMIEQLSALPYRLNSDVPDRMRALDKSLHARWETGDFIWPAAWQPAYPPREFWYLYGSVRAG